MKTWELKFVKNQNERLELLSSGVFAIKRKKLYRNRTDLPKMRLDSVSERTKIYPSQENWNYDSIFDQISTVLVQVALQGLPITSCQCRFNGTANNEKNKQLSVLAKPYLMSLFFVTEKFLIPLRSHNSGKQN